MYMCVNKYVCFVMIYYSKEANVLFTVIWRHTYGNKPLR